MARGGKRAGAGRPKGSRGKATQARDARAAAAVETVATEPEIMPVDVMLAAMRRHYGIAKAYEAAEKDADLSDLATSHFNAAATAARFASPYFHPKLAPTAPATDDGAPMIGHLTELETVRRLAFVLELAARGLLKAQKE